MSKVEVPSIESASIGSEPEIETTPNDASAGGKPDAPALSWRERAALAEERATELESKIKEAEASRDEARAQVQAEQRARALDAELHKADPIDADTVRALIELAMSHQPNADAAKAVAELKKRKPFLFREAPRRSAMGAYASDNAFDETRTLAEEARLTGDRNTLLRYLHARRGL